MRRFYWTLALLLVGDGVVAAVMPNRHMRRWTRGPRWYRRIMRPFAEHAETTRALGVAEALGALWWTSRMRDLPD